MRPSPLAQVAADPDQIQIMSPTRDEADRRRPGGARLRYTQIVASSWQRCAGEATPSYRESSRRGGPSLMQPEPSVPPSGRESRAVGNAK